MTILHMNILKLNPLNKCVPILSVLLLFVGFTSCSAKWEEIKTKDGFNIIKNKDGAVLGYSPKSGITTIETDGYAFKDLNKNGSLDIYEDWRRPADERSKDLASKMSIEQIAGLMLYSSHNRIPGGLHGNGIFNGKLFSEANVPPYTLSDGQVKMLKEDNLRHILVTSVESPNIAAKWNNNAQAFAESLGLGIPINNSSDPRHGAPSDAEFKAGAGGTISRWTTSLGMAASFDPALVKKFGEIASIEYRALGLTTALSPQVDIATEPRWWRFPGTFGESPELSTAMAKAYCEGFQYSSSGKLIANGWGYESVNAMVKHWPGGGSGESGRDAHVGIGKYAVFPGNNLDAHLKPFTEGAFKLDDATKMASAVMPYYTISYHQDPSGKNVGNGFSNYLIKDLLRDKYGYNGVVCTDWSITANAPSKFIHGGKPWGVDSLTVAERHYMVIMAGVDQFGGNDASGPILEAYQLGVKEHGEAFMRKRFKLSAVRLLKNIFRVGLFENAYLSPVASDSIVGQSEFMKLGFESQLKSLVLLKNKNNVLPLQKKAKVYIPKVDVYKRGFFASNEYITKDCINKQVVSKYFEVVNKPEDAEVAIVMINSPYNWCVFSGSSEEDVKNGGNGYIPITLKYKEYKAIHAREKSIAWDPDETLMNRSYKGKIVIAKNHKDLDVVLDTKKAMDGKPVIVIIDIETPTVIAEFEPYIDGLLLNFQVQDQALLEVLSGAYEPTALLPFQMPANMKTVEEQLEDVPYDMECHVDTDGNIYNFAFGLNWSGQIKDERFQKYAIKK